MKKGHITLALAFPFVFSFSFTAKSQDHSTDDITTSYYGNNSRNPCITPSQYAELDRECAENCKRLGLPFGTTKGQLTTSLNWPLQPAAGSTDCGYHFIGAYVDQNTAAGSILDYACGSNTYDGHQGTDIAVWPFGFYKMDNNQVEVIAAAAGTIIQKADGNFDRNCASNTMTANSIIIQHADGTYALYWHMKSNSVTSKVVGQTVVQGEYLGIAGSSGSSSGPHLHFEIRTGSTSTTYKDPFSGPCNTLNANSWWANQKPHTDPTVIKVSVNTTDIVLPGCPLTETPNESNTFNIPFQGPGLSPGYAKFYLFIRDDSTGMVADCKILNPNGTIFNSWTYTASAYNKTYIKSYSKLLPTIAGTYTFQATYNGETCSKPFSITTATGLPNFSNNDQIKISPNPSHGEFTIERTDAIENTFELYNVLGDEVAVYSLNQQTTSVSLHLEHGIYFYKIKNERQQPMIGKIIIE